ETELEFRRVLSDLDLRVTPDIQAEDNKAGEIKKGDLFIMLDSTEVVQTIRIVNSPTDNVTVNKIKQVEIMPNGSRESVFVPSYTSYHTVRKDEEPNEGNAYYDTFGILAKSLQFTDFIRWELMSKGWDGDAETSFKSESFSYTEGGYYGTILRQSVRLYDKDGDFIEMLPKGSRVFATMELPFATGYEDETKIRIVGFTRNGTHETIENVGTYFIDGIRKGRPTIEVNEVKRRDE